MIVLLEIVVIGAAVFGVVAYALGRIGGLAPVVPDDGDDGLPSGRLAPDAVDRARFGLAFRGYRMGEVDRVLDRLRDELSARDAELADQHQQDECPTPVGGAEYASAGSVATTAGKTTATTPAPAPAPSVRVARPRGAHARPAGAAKPDRRDITAAEPDTEDRS